MTSTERVKDRRHFIKRSIIYVMGGKCQCCGYDKYQGALELHHINPEEKDFSFGENSNKNWESIEKELPKCILVCANCHREIHGGLIDNKILISSYNEEKAQEIRENPYWRSSRSKTKYYCSVCGKEITSGSRGMCVDCAKKAQRVTTWPDREALKILIRTTPFTKIAQQFNVSSNTIRKWCVHYNLPSRVKDIKNYTNEEWKNI